MEIFPKLFNRVVWNLFNDLTGMKAVPKSSDTFYPMNVIWDKAANRNSPKFLKFLIFFF